MKNRILAFVLAIALSAAGFNLSYANVGPKKIAAKSAVKIEKTTTVKKSSNTMKHKKHVKAAKKSVKKAEIKAEKNADKK